MSGATAIAEPCAPLTLRDPQGERLGAAVDNGCGGRMIGPPLRGPR